jgi:RNA polymerase sigma factor (sigma-70 family)
MHERDDNALLQEFVANGSEAAFAAIVARHVNKVYSVALRHTSRAHQAEEITQAVFVILARRAHKLSKPVVLSGWLYHTARLTALTLVRSEIRRAHREEEAHMQTIVNQTEPDLWAQIAPELDAAMAGLNEKERNAIVLRYFDNKTLREVGGALGITEDAAKMRLARAVDRLRALFTKRGLTLSVGVLTTSVAANSVQAAPHGLGFTISATTSKAAATAASVTTLVNGTLNHILMTTFQKTLITASLLAAVTAGIYEARQANLLKAQVAALQSHQARATTTLEIRRERDDALRQLAALTAANQSSNQNTSELLKLRGEVARLRAEANHTDNPTQVAVKEWVNRVTQLKDRLRARPEAGIPELEYLEEEDWLAAVKERNLSTENEYRRALSTLRGAAESKVGSLINDALQKYLEANGKAFPTDLSQLREFFETPLSDAVLERWQIAPAKTVPNIGVGKTIITQKSAVDDVLDTRQAIGESGRGSTDFLNTTISETLKPVYAAYGAEHKGVIKAEDYYSALLAYAKTPEQKVAVQKLTEQQSIRR